MPKLSITCFAAGLAALCLAQTASSPTLTAYAVAIKAASTLSASYLYEQTGGVREEYTVDLMKPNLACIDEPTKLVVADGTQITVFDKTHNVFFHQPETGQSLKDVFNVDALSVWSGFFVPNAYQPTASRELGAVTRGSATYNGVEAQYGPAGASMITYLVDPLDKILRRATFVEGNGDGKSTYILYTRSLTVNGRPNSNLFAFTPPDGSREVSFAEMQGAKWYTSLSEAKTAAAASGRKIFVDFFATWCGPCKMLQADVLETERFKDLASKKLVLLRIDVDAQPEVSAQFGITAMPTQMVLDSQGNVLNKIVGYGGPDMFYSFLNPLISG
jgi:thiol-disulfide isomerase/thioredoxin